MSPRLVAVDWGTSSLRLALLGDDGAILARSAGPEGITKVADRDFAAVLARHAGGWIAAHGALPIVMIGMIASRNGWVEAPHVACPAGLGALVSGTKRLQADGFDIRFVPGLSFVDADGVPDVMRGEEIQVFGALAAGTGTVVLPGTHSKWVTVDGGVISGFRTYMTGELFAATLDHTIIGQLAGGRDHDAEAFRRGVLQSARDGALAHALFTARTLPLTGRLAASGVASYLSGVLIGAEFAANPDLAEVTVIGDDRLMDLYAQAAAALGRNAHAGSADAAFAGTFTLALHAGWI